MVLPDIDTFAVNNLLPKFDCGLCGNPVCMTLARKIKLKTQKPDECRFLRQENLRKIHEMMARKEVVRKHPHPNLDEEIIEIHPCTEEGQVTLEAQLRSKVNINDFYRDFFDQYQLCISLSESEMFDKMNCSPKMGYAFAEINGKRAHIFKTGKVIMRRADNREDALDTLSKISHVLLPARICSCGNILADCFAGACEICLEGGCRALPDIPEEEGHDAETTIWEVLKKSDKEPNRKLNDNFKALGDIMGEIRKIDNELEKGKLTNKRACKTKIDEVMVEVNKTCIESFLEGDITACTFIALTQYGLGRDLIRARDGLLSLEMEVNREQYECAVEILFDAYEAFDGRDMIASKAIKERYNEFISSWAVNASSMGIAKIATNGFYISRVLGKSVSDIGRFDKVTN